MRKEEIIAKLRKYRPFLQKNYGVVKIGVFGFVARGSMKNNSDIDIVVEIKKADPFILLDLKGELEKILNHKVDLVRMRKNLNPKLKYRIKKEVIYV